MAAAVDALFKNSLAETLTETEKAFYLGFVSMTEAILVAIQVVSWVVIGVILVVLANTMAMSARERRGEYAVLKTMGFKARHLVGLILGESLLLAVAGGLTGLALTFPAVQVIKAYLGQYFRVFPLTRATLGLGLAVALAVGLLAALFPRLAGRQGEYCRGAKKSGVKGERGKRGKIPGRTSAAISTGWKACATNSKLETRNKNWLLATGCWVTSRYQVFRPSISGFPPIYLRSILSYQ